MIYRRHSTLKAQFTHITPCSYSIYRTYWRHSRANYSLYIVKLITSLLYTYYIHSVFILYPYSIHTLSILYLYSIYLYSIHTLSIHYICSNKGQYIKYKKKYRTPFYDKRTSIVFMSDLEDYWMQQDTLGISRNTI